MIMKLFAYITIPEQPVSYYVFKLIHKTRLMNEYNFFIQISLLLLIGLHLNSYSVFTSERT